MARKTPTIRKKYVKDKSSSRTKVIEDNKRSRYDYISRNPVVKSILSKSEISAYNKNNQIDNNFNINNSDIELIDIESFSNEENLIIATADVRALSGIDFFENVPFFVSEGLPFYDLNLDNLNVFVPSDLSDLLSKSLKNTRDLEINIFSHEIVNLSVPKLSSLDTNILFLYQNDIANNTLLNIKKEALDRIESISDRLFSILDVSIHNNLINSSYENSLSIYDLLDDATTFAKRLEKEINYGNIAENFITSGYGEINGKISNLALDNKETFLNFSGKKDERFLDKQIDSENSILNTENLKIFYENISGFKISEKNNNFEESFLNYEILNSDRLLGQLMLNCGISIYSLYPNVDDIESNELKIKRSRVNSNALQSYPIIQVANLSPNSDIFKVNNYDILGIDGKSYDFNNVDITLRNNTINTLTDGDLDKRIIIKDHEPQTVLYSNKRSFFGSKFKDLNNFNNNIFTFTIKGETRNRLYENIFFDVKTNFDHWSPTFTQLPVRWFLDHDGRNAGRNNFSDSSLFNRFVSLATQEFVLDEEITKIFEEKIIGRDYQIGNVYIKSIVDVLFKKLFSKTLTIRYFDNIKKFLSIYPLDNFGEYRKNYNITRNIEVINRFEDNNEENNLSFSEIAMDQEGPSAGNWRQDFNESIDDIETNNLNNSSFLNDSFVLSASNSLLSKKNLNRFSYTRQPLTNTKESIKYIKTFKEKWINNYNSSNNLEKITSYKEKLQNKNILKVSNSCSIARRNLSNGFSKEFDSIIKKAKSKISNNQEFTFLYDEFEETSIDTFKNSKFISEESFYKNNFTKQFNNKIKNSSNYFFNFDQDDFDNQDHVFSSESYRGFLSKFYTKSFFRTKKSLMLKIIKDNIDIYSRNSSFYSNKEYFAFDILLATSLSNEKIEDKNLNVENVKLIIKNALMNLSGIDQQFSYLKKQPVDDIDYFNVNDIDKNKFTNSNAEYELNGLLKKEFGKESIEKVVDSIFNAKVLSSQENFILRTVIKQDFSTDTFCLTKPMANTTVNGNAEFPEFTMKNLPGYLCTFKFPFITKKHNFSNDSNINLGKIVSGKGVDFAAGEYALIGRLTNFINKNIETLSKLTYNHDIFINEDSTGIVFYNKKEDSTEIGGYTLDHEKNNKGVVMNLSYFDFDLNNQNNFLKNLTSFSGANINLAIGAQGFEEGDEIDIENFETKVLENNKDLYAAYSSNNNFKIPYSYFYLSNIPGTFSNKITAFAKDLLKIFDFKYDKLNNISDIDKFVEENGFIVRLLQDSLEVYGSTFVETYDIFNCLLVDEIKIKLEDKNSDRSLQFFNNLENFYSFDNTEIRNRVVDDLKKLYEESINEENKNYKIKSGVVDISTANVQNNELLINTSRYFKLKETLRILENSDISEALCHDLIHGYFLNFENNLERIEENTESLTITIDQIENELSNIEGESFDNFTDFITNEFYQNKISKDLQEIMFYKNLYNETFIRNNIYNTNKEKYENLDIFNHRKIFETNMFNRAKSSCGIIAKNIEEGELKKIDIIRLPIEYSFLNKLGERGILEVSIMPVNIKYPEIEYKEIKYYYTPFLTDVTSNFIEDFDISTGNYLGFYNDAQKISERYCIVDKSTAINEVRNILFNALSLGSETSGSIRAERIEAVIRKIVDDSIMSSAIKSINYISQKHLDENVKLTSENIENLISGKTINMVSSLSEDDLVKIFDSYTENEFQFIAGNEEYLSIDTNQNILSNNDFYKKFLLQIDKDVAETDIIKSMLPNVFYDFFNMKLDRSSFEISDSIDSIEYRYGSNVLLEDSANKCFTYYIGARIL